VPAFNININININISLLTAFNDVYALFPGWLADLPASWNAPKITGVAGVV
jgi:hypothetical protein